MCFVGKDKELNINRIDLRGPQTSQVDMSQIFINVGQENRQGRMQTRSNEVDGGTKEETDQRGTMLQNYAICPQGSHRHMWLMNLIKCKIQGTCVQYCLAQTWNIFTIAESSIGWCQSKKAADNEGQTLRETSEGQMEEEDSE